MTGCFGRYSPCPGESQQPDGLVSQDLVGTYRDAAQRAVLLNADGTFTARGWPTDVLGSSEHGKGDGSWELSGPESHDFPAALTFRRFSDEAAGTKEEAAYGTGLYVDGSRQDPRLHEYEGDPAACHLNRFKRMN
ncbi:MULTISPECIES: hypothetical protein [Streptomyces]